MGEKNLPDSGATSRASEMPGTSDSPEDSFTTTEFIDKIKETLLLATEISRHSAAKQNPAIQNLIKMQCGNSLQLLSTLNQNTLNPRAKEHNFKKTNFADVEKFALLSEINDAIIDKTIHYTERVKNIKEGKQDLIEVHAKLSKNFSKIELRDFNAKKFTPTRNNPNLAQTGLKRKYQDVPGGAQNPTPHKRMITFLAGANVPRPQLVYKMKVDNSYSTPFIPRLTRKPNANALAFAESMTPVSYPSPSNPITTGAKSTDLVTPPTHFYPHPYQKEIEQFEVPLEFLEPEKAVEMDEVPTIEDLKPVALVKTKDQLKKLVETLKKYTEIAVDVEHHSFRTYQGITCLMQISTADQDYIIDVFPLWHEAELLNEIFTDPKILKIFHGADYDIIWLQRDLGIYVVNMFDTGLAAKLLNYSHMSLSYLVLKFADFSLDKRFQLADWRIRPLPEEMLEYARYDTRFLLYIYRKMKAELLAQSDASANLLRVVMDKSRDLCLKRYEKKLLEPSDHITLIWKHNLKFNSRQLATLKELYTWRDFIARNEDESTGYVLPNNLLLKICEILPREQQGILACCNPIPPLVRQHINEIHKLILDTRSKVNTGLADTVTALDDPSLVIGRRPRGGEQSIDLSNDRKIDESSAKKGSAEDPRVDHLEIVPLLSASGKGKFELSQKKDSEMFVENSRDQPKVATKGNGGLKSISKMFISNMAAYTRKDTEQRQAKAKVDHLFDDYVSPFQRYLKAIQDKKQQPLQSNGNSISSNEDITKVKTDFEMKSL